MLCNACVHMAIGRPGQAWARGQARAKEDQGFRQARRAGPDYSRALGVWLPHSSPLLMRARRARARGDQQARARGDQGFRQARPGQGQGGSTGQGQGGSRVFYLSGYACMCVRHTMAPPHVAGRVVSPLLILCHHHHHHHHQ